MDLYQFSGARCLGPPGRRWLARVSALTLAILGIYQLVVGAKQLRQGAFTS